MKRREFILASAGAVISFLMGAACKKKTETHQLTHGGETLLEKTSATPSGENLTAKNLKTAFEAETLRSKKYSKFAEVAEKEGKGQIALLFRGASQAQMNQRKFDALTLEDFGVAPGEPETVEIKTGDTASNIEMLLGETELKARRYASFEDQAKEDKNLGAERSFAHARKADEHNAPFFKDALDALKADKEIEQVEYYICPVCGYMNIGPMSMACPVCRTPASLFTKVE